jgi:antirestriction protein ArdC
MNKASKFDLYQVVTDRIIGLMETHGANWVNPFNRRAGSYRAHNPITGKAYQGINTFLLATTPYPVPMFAGYGQWADKKCQVKRGEKSTMIVYWKILENRKTVEGVETVTKRPLLRYLNVFNVDQVEGDYADALRAKALSPVVTVVDMVAFADAFVTATGATIKSSNEPHAYYSPALDFVHMPSRESFEATPTSTATECYYSTMLHELTHWTGHSSRLSRDFSGRFGNEAYAFEELVAELGSAMLCAELGISVEPRADHAQYLNSWVKVLKGDNGAILKAASLAKAAAAYLSACQETEEEEIAA